MMQFVPFLGDTYKLYMPHLLHLLLNRLITNAAHESPQRFLRCWALKIWASFWKDQRARNHTTTLRLHAGLYVEQCPNVWLIFMFMVGSLKLDWLIESAFTEDRMQGPSNWMKWIQVCKQLVIRAHSDTQTWSPKRFLWWVGTSWNPSSSPGCTYFFEA